MDINQVVDILVKLALAGAAIVLATIALRWLSALKPGTPGETAVLAAIEKYLFMATAAGDHVALDVFVTLQKKLESADKKAVADSIYAILPSTLTVEGRVVSMAWVKTLISQERFEALIAAAYQELYAFVLANEAYLHSKIGPLPAPTLGKVVMITEQPKGN